MKKNLICVAAIANEVLQIVAVTNPDEDFVFNSIFLNAFAYLT